MRYIANPKTIILTIIPANDDIANSEALKLAKQVDPGRSRTLGVLTKCDLMDEGTHCGEVLLNRTYPLSHGYVAVCNRGTKASMSGVSISLQMKTEQQFFASHEVYGKKNILSRCTTLRLATILNGVFVRHIHKSLPEVRENIIQNLTEVEKRLETLGAPIHTLPQHRKSKVLLNLINEYVHSLTQFVNGTDLTAPTSAPPPPPPSASGGGGGGGRPNSYTYQQQHQDQYLEQGRQGGAAEAVAQVSNEETLLELRGGARLKFIIDRLFCDTIRDVSPFAGVSDDDICMIISNANAHQPSLFVPEKTFHTIVKSQIHRLEYPCMECIDLVRNEMIKLVEHVAVNSSVARFPKLYNKLIDTVNQMLSKGHAECKDMVKSLIKIETAWLNTSHPNFIGGARAVLRTMTTMQEERQRQKERQEVIRSRTFGLLGNPDKVSAPLEGEAQGYNNSSLIHESHDASKQKKSSSWSWFGSSSNTSNTADSSADDPASSADGGGASDVNMRDAFNDDYDSEDEEGLYAYSDSQARARDGGGNVHQQRQFNDFEYDYTQPRRPLAPAARATHAARGPYSGGGGGGDYYGGGGYDAHSGVYGMVRLPSMPKHVKRNYAVKTEKEQIEVRANKAMNRGRAASEGVCAMSKCQTA